MTQIKKVVAAPIVRRLAKKDGVDLTTITGTGRNGAITKADYEAHVGRKSTPQPARDLPPREERGTMNHMKAEPKFADKKSIGGMEFTRSRTGLDHSFRKKLDIPPHLKNNELQYRFVDEDRLQAMRELGYAEVDQASLSQDEEITVRRRVGKDENGASKYAVLMATPKIWYDERQKAKDELLRRREEQMMTGPVDNKGQPLGEDFYNKGSQMS